MTAPDPTRVHVVTAPHLIPNTGTWFGWCSCGAEFTAADADGVREAGQPHRDAETARVGQVDRQRDEARRLRRGARREQRRSKAVHSGGKGRGVG